MEDATGEGVGFMEEKTVELGLEGYMRFQKKRNKEKDIPWGKNSMFLYKKWWKKPTKVSEVW